MLLLSKDVRKLNTQARYKKKRNENTKKNPRRVHSHRIEGIPLVFFSVKKLLKTSTCPMPIIRTTIDSPIDQAITWLFKSSAKALPCASRSLKWVWSSKTSFKLSWSVSEADSTWKREIICLILVYNIIIKFPFKRNGLPCCEDEPGSEKIALKWKSSIWIFLYLRYLFVLYANDRYTKLYSNKLKCINFTKYKTKDKSLSFVNYIIRVL